MRMNDYRRERRWRQERQCRVDGLCVYVFFVMCIYFLFLYPHPSFVNSNFERYLSRYILLTLGVLLLIPALLEVRIRVESALRVRPNS